MAIFTLDMINQERKKQSDTQVIMRSTTLDFEGQGVRQLSCLPCSHRRIRLLTVVAAAQFTAEQKGDRCPEKDAP
jgi:hypothetical protein